MTETELMKCREMIQRLDLAIEESSETVILMTDQDLNPSMVIGFIHGLRAAKKMVKQIIKREE